MQCMHFVIALDKKKPNITRYDMANKTAKMPSTEINIDIINYIISYLWLSIISDELIR